MRTLVDRPCFQQLMCGCQMSFSMGARTILVPFVWDVFGDRWQVLGQLGSSGVNRGARAAVSSGKIAPASHFAPPQHEIWKFRQNRRSLKFVFFGIFVVLKAFGFSRRLKMLHIFMWIHPGLAWLYQTGNNSVPQKVNFRAPDIFGHLSVLSAFFCERFAFLGELMFFNC